MTQLRLEDYDLTFSTEEEMLADTTPAIRESSAVDFTPPEGFEVVGEPMTRAEMEAENVEPGAVRQLGRGFAGGLLRAGGSLGGTTLRYLSRVEWDPLNIAGQNIEAKFDYLAAPYGPTETVDHFNPASAKWWAYSIGNLGGSIIPPVVGAAAAAAISPGTGGTSLLTLPAVIGGTVGGLQEGMATWREMSLDPTKTKAERDSAAEKMFVGSALLNTLSFGILFKTAPRGLKGQLLGRFLGGTTEAVTESLEEPLSTWLQGESIDGSTLQDMLAVGLPSFIVGGVLGGNVLEPANIEKAENLANKLADAAIADGNRQMTNEEMLSIVQELHGKAAPATLTEEEQAQVFVRNITSEREIIWRRPKAIAQELKKLERPLNQADFEIVKDQMLVREKAAKKGQMFTDETTVEMLLEEQGVTVEEDVAEAFTPEQLAEMREAYDLDEGIAALAATVANLGITQAAREAGISPQAFVRQHIQGFQKGGKAGRRAATKLKREANEAVREAKRFLDEETAEVAPIAKLDAAKAQKELLKKLRVDVDVAADKTFTIETTARDPVSVITGTIQTLETGEQVLAVDTVAEVEGNPLPGSWLSLAADAIIQRAVDVDAQGIILPVQSAQIATEISSTLGVEVASLAVEGEARLVVPTRPPVSVAIPKSHDEAVAMGENATPAELEDLKRLYVEESAKAHALMRAGKLEEAAPISSGPVHLLGEAVKAAEGRLEQTRGKKARGAISPFARHAKYLFRGLTAPDLSTAIHEFAHFFALTSTGKIQTMIEQAARDLGWKHTKVDKWTKHEHDLFAKNLEAYFLMKHAPTKKLQRLYEALRQQMGHIYRTIKEVIGLDMVPAELVRTYDYLFTGTELSEQIADTMEEQVGALMQAGLGTESYFDSIEMPRGTTFGGKRDTVTWNQMLSDSRDILEETDTYKKFVAFTKQMEGTDIPEPSELVAAVLAATGHQAVLESYLAGDVTPLRQANFEQYSNRMWEAVNDIYSRYGQGLQTARIFHARKEMMDALFQLGRKLTPSEMRRLKAVIDDPLNLKKVQEFNGYVQGGLAKKVFLSLWYNFILSNPGTSAKNIFSNLIWQTYLGFDRFTLAAVDLVQSKVEARPRERFFSEGFIIIRGLLGFFRNRRGRAVAYDAMFKRGELGGTTVYDEAVGPLRNVMEDLLEDRFGATGRRIGKVLTAPFRSLRAMDLWFKAVAEESQIKADLYRLEQAGEHAPVVLQSMFNELLKNPAYETRAREAIKEEAETLREEGVDIPKGSIEAITRKIGPEEAYALIAKLRSYTFAEHATFEDTPGEFTKRFQQARDAWGIPGRLIVPFVRIISNLTKRGAELTPGLGLLAPSWGLSKTEVAAKQIEGLIVGLAIWIALEKGDITGPPPEDKAEREAAYRRGWRPWSFRIGDTWIDYRTFEPFGFAVGLATSLLQIGKQAQTEEEGMDVLFKLSAVGKDFILDNSYMSGVTQAFGSARQMENKFAYTTTSFIPYSSLWRSIHRSSGEFRENKGFMSVFAQSVPFMEQPGVRRDIWFQKVVKENSLFREWFPVNWQSQKDDPVENTLQSLELYPGIPSSKMVLKKGGELVEVDEDIYKEFLEEYGVKGKELIFNKIQGTYFYSMSKERQAKVLDDGLERIRTRARSKAKGQMLRRVKAAT